MLRTYYYKNVFTYVCNQAVGIIFFSVYSYFLYNYKGNPPFLPLIISLIFFSLQITKGYLLYFPSTYINFSSTGVSLKKFKQEVKFIEWENVRKIELEIKNEWMLNKMYPLVKTVIN